MKATAFAMLKPLDQGAYVADAFRSAILRRSMKREWARTVFRSRPLRLFFLFLTAVAMYTPLALFLPLVVLLVGPILYGLPHLFASIRYVHHGVNHGHPAKTASLSKQCMRFAGVIFVMVSLLRIFSDVIVSSFPDHKISALFSVFIGLNTPPLFVESLSAVITLAGLCVIYRKEPKKFFLGSIILLPVLIASWLTPTWTAGALVLLHNFNGFVYWIAGAKTSADRHTAIASSIIFSLLTFGLLFGAFDFVYKLSQPMFDLSFGRMSYIDFGRLIAPWSQDQHVWFHCVSAYAFGQAMHYFVWLKALPETHLPHAAPVSFKDSLRLLRRDLGVRTTAVVITTCLAGLLAFLFCNMETSRLVYFSVASYHGFMEMAGMGLLTRQLVRT